MYLGIDTTNNNLCYALLDDRKLLFYENLYPYSNAAEILPPKIAQLFQYFAITIHDIKKIISVTGPGGFSGVRIGTAFVTGLSANTEIDIIGISSLEAAGFSIENPQKNSIIISCLDARRDGVYLGIYQDDYTPLITDSVIHIKDLQSLLVAYQNKPYYLSGHGHAIIQPMLDANLLLNKIDHTMAEIFTPQALLKKLSKDNTPIYLRQPDAKLPKNKIT